MFTLIVDYAVAPDGGSLALSVERLDGKTECFVINRSFASRGTPEHNAVKSNLRSLFAEQSRISRRPGSRECCTQALLSLCGAVADA